MATVITNTIPFAEEEEFEGSENFDSDVALKEQNTGGFIVDDDIKAEWLLKKLKDKEEFANKMIDFYKSQIEKTQKDLDNFRSYAEFKLNQYLVSGLVPLKQTKTELKYQLPTATIKLKKQAPNFLYENDAFMAELSEKHMDEFIEQKPFLKWGELKKDLVVLSDGTVALNSTGEILNHITALEKDDKFIISFNKETNNDN